MNQSMMGKAEEDEAGERGGGRTSASPVDHDEEAMKMRGFVRARRVGRDLARFGGLILEKTMAKQGQARRNTLKKR